MSTHIHLELKAISSAYMWFRVLSDQKIDAHGNMVDSTNAMASATFNYDFEHRPNNVWHLHIDVSIHVVPIAEIKVRVTFETVYEGSIEPILNMEVIQEVCTIACNHCLNGFNEQCEVHGISYRHDKVDLTSANAAAYLSAHYAKELKPLENTWYAKESAKFTPGGKTNLLCKIPFMVMDEVFFYAKGFDYQHNAAVLFKHVPEPCYYTTKLRCSTIDTEDVTLSGRHSVYYLLCLDCALQLLVGDHDYRFDQLVDQGLTPEVRKNFIRWGTEYFDYMTKTLDAAGVRMPNFDNRPDWNAVVR